MPIVGWGSGEDSSGAAPSAFSGGIAGVDSNLKGEQYLAQFPRELQQGARDYVSGLTMPTGNPRKTNVIKYIASKYGEDIGVPADDTTFGARRTMRNDLNKSTPGSIGGQIQFMRTAINHLSKAAGYAEDLHNWDLGIAPLTWGANWLGSLTTAQRAKMDSLKDAAERYGQEITKFYAGSPGGEAERERFIGALSGVKSPQELAAVIASERNLIPGRGDEIQNRIQSTFGPLAGQFPVHSDESRKSLASLDASIARMRGQQPAANAQQPAAQGQEPQAQAPAAQFTPDQVKQEMIRRKLIQQ